MLQLDWRKVKQGKALLDTKDNVMHNVIKNVFCISFHNFSILSLLPSRHVPTTMITSGASATILGILNLSQPNQPARPEKKSRSHFLFSFRVMHDWE